jgi:hypothetical protein
VTTVKANLCNQRQDLAIALWERNAVGHHVTNIVVTELQEDATHAISKGIGIMADGSCGSLTYYDTPVRGEHGWRITHRRIRGSRLFKPTG